MSLDNFSNLLLLLVSKQLLHLSLLPLKETYEEDLLLLLLRVMFHELQHLSVQLSKVVDHVLVLNQLQRLRKRTS